MSMAKRIVRSSRELKALREAARIGFEALDRGEFKEFRNPRERERYLYKLSQRDRRGR